MFDTLTPYDRMLIEQANEHRPQLLAIIGEYQLGLMTDIELLERIAAALDD